VLDKGGKINGQTVRARVAMFGKDEDMGIPPSEWRIEVHGNLPKLLEICKKR